MSRISSRPPISSVVNPDRCRACGTCVEICEFGAPMLIEQESSSQPEPLRHSWIDPMICTGCGTCVGRCQMDAISIKNDISTIDYNYCIGCGLCVPTCPSNALKLEKNKKKFTPPKSSYSLYLKIQKQRQGRWAKYKTILKLIFGMKLYYLLKKK